jgi:AbrB family looped-hinge helix DNA binding protein
MYARISIYEKACGLAAVLRRRALACGKRKSIIGEIWLQICHFNGNLNAMKITLDAAGRIVVPKALRQTLGLKPGQALDIRAGDDRLEIEIAATPMQLKKRGKDVVAVPDTKLPSLSAEQVRDTLERVRR